MSDETLVSAGVNDAEKILLVQFACTGQNMEERQKCLCYEREPLGYGRDCRHRKHPVDKGQYGVCWSPNACATKSYLYIKHVEEQMQKLKK